MLGPFPHTDFDRIGAIIDGIIGRFEFRFFLNGYIQITPTNGRSIKKESQGCINRPSGFGALVKQEDL